MPYDICSRRFLCLRMSDGGQDNMNWSSVHLSGKRVLPLDDLSLNIFFSDCRNLYINESSRCRFGIPREISSVHSEAASLDAAWQYNN